MVSSTRQRTPLDALARDISATRLGILLGAARVRDGASLADVSRRLGLSYTSVVLKMIEAGRYPVPAEDIPALVEAYRVDPATLLPDRDGLEVNVRKGRLRAGRKELKVGDRRSIDVMLREYLEFVCSMRTIPAGQSIAPETLRADDMTVLARTLGLEADEVERRLVALLEAAATRAREERISAWEDAHPTLAGSGTDGDAG